MRNAHRHLLFLAPLVVVYACGDVPEPTATPARQFNPVSLNTRLASAGPADSLARGLARALSDPAMRSQVREDLRDAPAARHAIHLTSYLLGARGRLLAEGAAKQLGVSDAELRGMLNRLPALELVMERGYDRVTWSGTDDIVVYGTSIRGDSLVHLQQQPTGFRVDGSQVTVSLRLPVPFPSLAVRPIESRFGLDPEAERAGAVAQRRVTVSTREEELEQITRAQDLKPVPRVSYSIDPCPGGICDDTGGGGSPSTEYGGVQAGIASWGYCVANVPLSDDADLDGLRDSCEQQLAEKFAPRLIMATADEAPGREPRWSVTRMRPTWPDPSTIKIYYALSYYRDPGAPIFALEAHDGDSEYIILELHNTNQSPGNWWKVDYMTLSAHWNAGSTYDHTRRYDHSVIEWDVENRGRPRVWVSKNKHANYVTRSQCIGYWHEQCGYQWNYAVFTTQYWADANLGNKWNPEAPGAQPINPSVTVRYPGTAGTSSNTFEYYWSEISYPNFFAGWHIQNGQAISGGYGLSLYYYRF